MATPRPDALRQAIRAILNAEVFSNACSPNTFIQAQRAAWIRDSWNWLDSQETAC